jgi:hypothetical protein
MISKPMQMIWNSGIPGIEMVLMFQNLIILQSSLKQISAGNRTGW